MGKNDWFTKAFRPSNFMLFSNNKKLKVIAIQNILLKNKSKTTKKVRQWINDDKSAYIREDLAYNLICWINLDVIKADEFRKKIGIMNNQLIQREREIISIIMKIFAKWIMVRQYKIDGLPNEVDLCFIVQRLVIEVDEDDHVYYDELKHQIRQNLIENLGFSFVRINPDVVSLDLDVEIAKLYSYINKSSVRLAVNSTEKSLKENFAK